MFKLYSPVQVVLLLCLAACFILTQSFTKENFKYQKIRQFIPEGYQVYDTASGDLNGDGYEDLVLVLKSNIESVTSEGVRPLLVLTGKYRGYFDLFARNDKVVLCESCGGVFGDPYQKVTINNGFLSIEHNVGATYKWSRVITFKYEAECKEMVLFEDKTNSYHASAPNKQTGFSSNKRDFGVLPFSCYTYNKGF
jgi:hypothetical protein